MTLKIEFCIGMTEYKGDILITFGYYDNSSYIVRINKEELNRLIYSNLFEEYHEKTNNISLCDEYQGSNIYEDIYKFINNPYNDIINFELGYIYLKNRQNAGSFTYFLRCVEYTKCNDLRYESMINMSFCLADNKRDPLQNYLV